MKSFNYGRYMRAVKRIDRALAASHKVEVQSHPLQSFIDVVIGWSGLAIGNSKPRTLQFLRRQRRQIEYEYAASITKKPDFVGVGGFSSCAALRSNYAHWRRINELEVNKPDFQVLAENCLMECPREEDT